MKLIVGLGNPGRKYEQTRHNVGYDVLAELYRRHATGKPRERFQGELAEAEIEGARVLLLRPLTFMNRSGASVRQVSDYYRINEEDLLIVCDDFNLPLAKLRFRAQGSSGGQKGLEDIIRHLGTQEFARLRIGIGPVAEGWEASRFVLRKFTREEQPAIEQAIERAADAAVVWPREGVQACMNQYNAG